MKIHFHVKYNLAPKRKSVENGKIYGMFGINEEYGERDFVKPFDIDVQPGEIVYFTGISGTGKSSCLRQFKEQTNAFNLDDIVIDKDKTIIENFSSFEKGVEIAGRCGLSEAFLFVRYFHELSDGQRYRFKIAKAIDEGHKVIVADEFLATLDRETAKVIAFNLRKIANKYGLIFALASTHVDIIEDLQPDHLIRFTSDGVELDKVEKKNEFHFTKICGLREGLEQIGSISKSGIIEGIQ